jgi:flavin-dependent dehydrogenase
MECPSSAGSRQAIVVGASTAGLYIACLLARGGVAVRLFEQAEELGPPARTLILTRRINDALGYVPSQAIVNHTRTIALFSSRRSLTVELDEPDLIVERSRLVQLLAQQAAAAGVEIRLGCRFVGLEPARGGLILTLESAGGRRIEPIRTRTLIGADGAASRVASAVGKGARPAIALLQARVALPYGAGAGTTQVWFDPAGTRYFYWLVPESAGQAVVGLIAEGEQQARRSLERFLGDRGLVPLEYQEAQVPCSMTGPSPWCTVAGARVLLVGDAGGQVKVTTVGGVVTGLWGARAAAQAILRGTSYRRELGGLRRELALHQLVRRALNRFTAADYDELLDLVNRRTKGILAARNRDEIGHILFPALFTQPRLLLLAARTAGRSGAGAQRSWPVGAGSPRLYRLAAFVSSQQPLLRPDRAPSLAMED